MISYDFEGKTVVVTGGGRGIGRRIVERMLHHGANVALCRRNATDLEALEADIANTVAERMVASHAPEDQTDTVEKIRERLTCAAVDVRDIDALRAFLDATVTKYGDVDVLVNNAGIMTHEDPCDITPAMWDNILGTNLESTFFASQWFARHHKDTGTPGNIVNIASISAKTHLPNDLLYSLSKAGVVNITKSLARSLGEYGIRVNAVGPGSTPTDLNAEMYADKAVEAALCERLPLGRRATKDDIANAVMFLASDEADYITGQVLYVDGGWLLT